MEHKLEEEDENFGQEGAYAPDDHLYEPRLDVHVLVWVEVVIMVHWHVLVSVDSTLEDL